jgi:UDP-3-O-[3-hydroxymyristoyl] N-acetylglucosamine deacetylase
MDGLPEPLMPVPAAVCQHTLKAPIGCVGVGVHTGRRVSLTLRPAGVGHGIVFRRTDLGIDIPARFDHVADTRFCTVLGHPLYPEARVGTVEHLMAALAGCGIDNLLVEIDGPEVPILDGSSASFVFLLDCAGIAEQDAPCALIEVLRVVRVENREGFAELRPAPFGFEMALSIEFQASAIGRQAFSLRLTPESFRRDLARARTFALRQDVAQLQAAGLAQGGSLANAVVVDGGRVLNPGGLRMRDEFVRHKLLDVAGDMALAGAPLRGRFVAHHSGHGLNNRVLRAMLAQSSAWRRVTPDALSGISGIPLPAAAAAA